MGCLQIDIEISTAALAVVSFERLVLKGLVTKLNRRLTMATCLLLAFKFNEYVPCACVSFVCVLLLLTHSLTPPPPPHCRYQLSEDGEQGSSSAGVLKMDALFLFFDRDWRLSRKQVRLRLRLLSLVSATVFRVV